MIEPEHHNWLVHRDLALDESTLEVIDDRGVWRFDDIDLTVTLKGRELYSMRADDFDSVRGETCWERALARDGWRVRARSRTVLTSSRRHFAIQADVDAYEGDSRAFYRTWHSVIPRNLV